MRVSEVVGALHAFRGLLCTATVETGEDGDVEFKLRLKATEQETVGQAVSVVSLFHELEYLCDLDKMHALCDRFGINSNELVRLLPDRTGEKTSDVIDFASIDAAMKKRRED